MSSFCLPLTSLVLVTLCILLSLYSLNVERILLNEKAEKERLAFFLKMRMKKSGTMSRRNSFSSSAASLHNYSSTALPLAFLSSSRFSSPEENAVLRGNDLRSKKNVSSVFHASEKSRNDRNSSNSVNTIDNRTMHLQRKKTKEMTDPWLSYHPMCDFTALLSCTPVFTSPYSSLAQFINIPFTFFYLPAIPNTAFAFLFYLVELGCCFYTLIYYWLTIVNVGITVAIASLLALKVHEVCPVLVSLYVLNILSFLVARQRYQHSLGSEYREHDEAGGEKKLFCRSSSCPSSRSNEKKETSKKETEKVLEDHGGKKKL